MHFYVAEFSGIWFGLLFFSPFSLCFFARYVSPRFFPCFFSDISSDIIFNCVLRQEDAQKKITKKNIRKQYRRKFPKNKCSLPCPYIPCVRFRSTMEFFDVASGRRPIAICGRGVTWHEHPLARTCERVLHSPSAPSV
jgi:hypothetical protein